MENLLANKPALATRTITAVFRGCFAVSPAGVCGSFPPVLAPGLDVPRENEMKNTIIFAVIILTLPVGSLFGESTSNNERHWSIEIAPVEDTPGHFTFEASLVYLYSDSKKNETVTSRRSGTDIIRIPKITVVAGEEADFALKGPDGEPTSSAHILIDEAGTQVTYSVMPRSEEGIHRSSANLNLSGNKPGVDNPD